MPDDIELIGTQQVHGEHAAGIDQVMRQIRLGDIHRETRNGWNQGSALRRIYNQTLSPPARRSRDGGNGRRKVSQQCINRIKAGTHVSTPVAAMASPDKGSPASPRRPSPPARW